MKAAISQRRYRICATGFLLLFVIILTGCLSEVPGGAGSEIGVPVQHLDIHKAISAIHMMKDVSILPNTSSMALDTFYTISFRRTDGAGGDLDFSSPNGRGLLQIHALALNGSGSHLPEVEFLLIRDVYLHLRSLVPDLPDPRELTVVRDYGLVQGRKMAD